MPQISRQPMSPEIEQRVFQIFFRTLAKTGKTEEIIDFLDDLLTPVERTMLAKRLAIAILVQKGWGYEAIKRTLKVTPATISKIKLWLSFKGTGFRRVFANQTKENEINEIIDDFKEALIEMTPIGYRSITKDLRKGAKHKIWRSRKSRSFI